MAFYLLCSFRLSSFLILETIYKFTSTTRYSIYGNIKKGDFQAEIVLYSSLPFNILKNISEIKVRIEQKTFYPVDITALSFEEEKEVGFIDKLDKKYVCIK